MQAGATPDEAPVVRPVRRGPGRLGTILVLAVVAIGIAVFTVVIDQPAAGDGVTILPGRSNTGGAPRVGDVPPDFQATAIDGKAISISALKGRPVWLTFGASWCPDCRAEAPELQGTFAKYGPAGLEVLGVFIDEPQSAVVDYANRAGFTFPLVADQRGSIADIYRTYGIPIHFFIGRDGTIKDVRIGRMTAADMDSLVQKIMVN